MDKTYYLNDGGQTSTLFQYSLSHVDQPKAQHKPKDGRSEVKQTSKGLETK